MATPLASLDALVHPHQIEIQEFGSYALVVDARSPEAFQDDHVPGAINVPVGSGDRERAGATVEYVGVQDTEPTVPYVLATHASRLVAGAAVLVYCDRGGLDSLIWAEPLRAAGFAVDVLPGGWSSYRRWVDAGLDVLPRALSFRLLVAPPVSGLSRIVARLVQRGQQVIDLTALAGQRLVPGLTLTGDAPPAQGGFETALLERLRRLDPRRPVWVRVSLCGLGDLRLPPGLRDVLARARGNRVEVALAARAQAWRDCLQSKGADAGQLLDAISSSACRPETAAVARWRALSNDGQLVEALSEIIEGYIGPRLKAQSWQRPPEVVALDSLTPEALRSVVDDWCGIHDRTSSGGSEA